MISVEMSGNVYVANVNVPQITQENIVNVITKDVVMKMVYCVQVISSLTGLSISVPVLHSLQVVLFLKIFSE